MLNMYSDVELTTALRSASEWRLRGAPSKSFAQYKEVQIHGPVDLRTDVQVLSVPGKETAAQPDLVGVVNAFRKLSQCNVLWQGDMMGA